MTLKSGRLVVLDIGKSSLKFVVCSADASRVEHSTSLPNVVVDAPPYPHFDTERAWNWLIANLADAQRKFQIDAIIPVTHGATAAIMRGPELALPVLDYEHTAPRSDDEAGYRALRPAFAETFSPDLPCGLNLGRQLWWQSTRFPERFGQADRILFYPQYWTWRLSGVSVSELTSIGCHTDLWLPEKKSLSSLVDALKWRRLFPAFRPAGESVGTISPEVVERTGLPSSVQVLNGIHDSNASYYRHLARYGEQPFSVLSTGTWIVAMGGARPLRELDETRDCLANVDALGHAVPCSRFMGGREFEALAGKLWVESADLALCDATVRDLMQRQTFALPSFAPSSGPFAGQTGSITGRLPRSDLEASCLAALYLALMSDVCLELIGSEGDIHVEGKLGGNAIFLRILAALRPQQPVFVTDDATGTASGAALLAAGIAPAIRYSSLAPRGDLSGLRKYAESWRERASGRVAANVTEGSNVRPDAH